MMLKRLGGFGLLLAVTGLLLGTAPSTASAKVRVAGGLAGEIEVDAPHQGVRPFTIPCCDWYWSRLTWTDWTGVEANGSGTYFAYCIGEPGCPEENGLYFDYPVLVHLYGVKNCSGKRTFTHIQTTFTGELPYWGSERVIRESLYCPQPPKAGGSGGNRRDTRIISYWDGGSDAGTPHYVRHPRKVGFNIGDGGYWLVRHADWRHWGDQRTTAHGRLASAALDGTPVDVRAWRHTYHSCRHPGDTASFYARAKIRIQGEGKWRKIPHNSLVPQCNNP